MSKPRVKKIFWIGLLFFYFCFAAYASEVQDQANTASNQKTQEVEPGQPGLAELLPKLVELSDKKSNLVKVLMRLPDVSTVMNRFEEIGNVVKEIENQAETLKSETVYAKKRYGILKTDLQNIKAELDRAVQYLADILAGVEKSKKFWLNEAWQWRSWQSAAQEDKAWQAKYDELCLIARETCQSALQLIDEKIEPFFAVQARAVEIQGDIAAFDFRIAKTWAQMMKQLRQQVPPPLISFRYIKQYDRQLLEEVILGLKSVNWSGWKIMRQEKWVLIGQLVVLMLVLFFISRYRIRIDELYPDHYYTRRRFSTGLFISTSIFSPFIISKEPFLILLLVIIAGFSAARLSPGFASRRWGVQIFYGIIIISIVSLLFLIMGIPLPINRLYVFSSATGGLVLCAWLFLTSYKIEKSKMYLSVVCISMAVFFIVIMLELFNYTEQAIYIFFSHIDTLFLCLIAWMLAVMAENLIQLVLKSQLVRNIEYLRSKVNVLSHRMVLLSRLGIIFILVSYLLETWSLAQNAMAAMKRFFSLGITIGTFHLTFGIVFSAMACIYGAIVLSYAIQAILSETTYKKHQLQHGVKISISKIIHYVFILAGVLLGLKILGVEMKSITIIGGALGIGIGFGLQGIARNFISGIILLFERPVKVGDYVTVEDQWGEIKSMGLRSTVVQSFDYSEIVVPNHDLIDFKVINWTLTDRFMRIIVNVGVAYGSKVEMVKQILIESAMASSKVTRLPEPQALFMKFGESALEFELRVWVSNIDDYLSVTSFLHEEIEKRFRESGITIAFPQRDLHIRAMAAPSIA